jgi:hypothetical protein
MRFFDLVLLLCAGFFIGAAVAASVSTPLKLTACPALVLVVAPAGIPAADCNGKSEMVHVTPMQ